MSGYGEMAREDAREAWYAKWVPSNDAQLARCPAKFRDEYRYTLARAREAESQLQAIRKSWESFATAIKIEYRGF